MEGNNSIAYTPSNIADIRFRIPLYQRPYSWDKEQIMQLLNDLKSQYTNDKDKNYYIGILNIAKTETDDNLYDLIDGQQRMTTLLLIASAVRSNYPYWQTFLLNRLDFYGRNEDKSYIYEGKESPKTNPRLIEAIKTINTFFQGGDKDLAKYIYKHAAFFLSEMPGDYTVIEKNIQFVRMNNRGKQLEAPDILKIKLSNNIADKNKKNFFETWNNISQMGCRENDKSNNYNYQVAQLRNILEEEVVDEPKESEIFYQSILTFPEFLLIALDRFYKDITIYHSKDKLLEEFGFGEKEKGIIWDETKVMDFLSLLCEQFDLYNKYFIKRDKDDSRYLLKKTTNDDQLIWSNEEKFDELRMFQSYLYVSKEPHNWMIDAFDYLAEQKCNISSIAFLNKLKQKDNENYSIIDNKIFIKDNSEANLTYPNINRYWFWRLDYYLWENRKEIFKNIQQLNIVENYIFRSNRSIEHIAPQHPKRDSKIVWTEENNKYLDCFGNLVIISSGQNSSLQNESFEVKRAYVESFINGSKTGSIESLKMLKIYDFESWNSKNIKTHQDSMINVLINSFQKKD